MAELRLILGAAGTGKTHTVLHEAALAAMDGNVLDSPPLLIITPEQQAVQMERAALAEIGRLRGDSQRWPATARLRVAGFSRLASLLEQGASDQAPLSEVGRSLLAWRVLSRKPEYLRILRGGGGKRDAASPHGKADMLTNCARQLAEQAMELLQYCCTPQTLSELAMLETGEAAERLDLLSRFLADFQDEQQSCGASFALPGARVAELLRPGAWPALEGLQVWVDGFASFTPAEELALAALLEHSRQLTATLLLDPACVVGPRDRDLFNWYAPTRGQYERWREIASRAGAAIKELQLKEQAKRWPCGSLLARLSESGPQASFSSDSAAHSDAHTFGCAVECADSASEAVWAAGEVLALARGERACGPLRFGEMSILCRDLGDYASVLALALTDHGIPHFIDRRRALAQHPASQLVARGLRMALGEAGDEDVYSLLATGLLPEPEDAQGGKAPWELEEYGRQQELKHWHWLEETDWKRWKRWLQREATEDAEQQVRRTIEQAAIAERLHQLDRWRRVVLAPVLSLQQSIAGLAQADRTVASVLELTWDCLLGEGVQQRLERWADETSGDAAALHRGVIPALAGLFEQFGKLCRSTLLAVDSSGDEQESISSSLLCRWLEAGLAELSVASPPSTQDMVMVTDVERGRHGEVKASLLLGLTSSTWPRQPVETGVFSPSERKRINKHGLAAAGRRLLGGGAEEQAAREPYLALVAATRPSDYLAVSRPLSGADGVALLPSPYFDGICSSVGFIKQAIAGAVTAPLQVSCATALADLIAWRKPSLELLDLARDIAQSHGSLMAGLRGMEWQEEQRLWKQRPLLPNGVVRKTLSWSEAGGELKCSVSRLETFAKCPFKHFARYLLRLREDQDRHDAAEMGLLYHELLRRAISGMPKDLAEFTAMDSGARHAALSSAITAIRSDILEEGGRQTAEYLLSRAGLLLELVLSAVADVLGAQNAVPLATEVGFGVGGELPAIELNCELGKVRLRGYIDRVDLLPGRRVAVTDYKTGKNVLNWARFLSGAQVQLMTYLLALVKLPLDGGEVAHPALASYQCIEPQWDKKNRIEMHAKNELNPGGKVDTNTLLTNALKETTRVICELGDRILSGEYAPYPLRTGTATECSGCAYRSFCGFDPMGGWEYRSLQGTSAKIKEAIEQGRDLAGSAMPGWKWTQ